MVPLWDIPEIRMLYAKNFLMSIDLNEDISRCLECDFRELVI